MAYKEEEFKKECLFCDFIRRKNTDVKIIYEVSLTIE